MLSEQIFEFTQDNIDTYLKAVSKEYCRISGKTMPAELILIGGASILINYGFRNMTTDIDALIMAASCMKDAINTVGDRFNLPNGWLNSDFENTASYTPKLLQYSIYYKTFSNIVTVRTISAEYLVAMKLRSGRQYKNDLSDILGILAEHEKQGNPLTLEQIKKAFVDLYDNWDMLSEHLQLFIENAMRSDNFVGQYEKTVRGENDADKLLADFDQRYPNIINNSNVDEIISMLRNKR